jgi:hypothetical protein
MSAVWSSAGQKIPRWAQIVQVNGSWLTCWFNSKSAVVVRNIGERMLGKLLGHQIAVYQTDCGRRLFTELCDPDTRVLTELNKPEQGRQSFHQGEREKMLSL